jgi:hypothetical protein
MQTQMGTAPGSGQRIREVEHVDRRWLLGAVIVFAASLASFAGLRWLYQATGPHPEVTVFMRRVKSVAKRLIPRVRRAPAE